MNLRDARIKRKRGLLTVLRLMQPIIGIDIWVGTFTCCKWLLLMLPFCTNRSTRKPFQVSLVVGRLGLI